MSEKKYALAVIGCGTISSTHAEAIINSRKGRLAAAYSRNQSRLDAFTEKYGIKGFTDYDELLEQKEIHAVSVCTPNGTHLDYGVKAAEAGKDVIIEKPIETTVERGRKLIEACRKNNVKLAVIYQNRFIEDVVNMKKAIGSGRLGNVFMVTASVKWFRDQNYYKSAPWRGTLGLDGGGAVINQAIHTADLMQWLAGDIESVQALKGTFTHEGMEGEDNAVAAIEFKNGAIGTFQASTSVVPAQERSIEVHGDKGTALLRGDAFKLLLGDSASENDKGNGNSAGASNPLAGMMADNHRKQYDAILGAFSNHQEPVVSGEESLKSLAFVEALYRSAESKKPVKPGDIIALTKH